MKSGKWDVRISRSRLLAAQYPSAAEGLEFYGHIAQFQKSLYRELEERCGIGQVPREHGTLRHELDLFVLLPHFASFLSVVEKRAPGPLAQAATGLRTTGGSQWQEMLTACWQAESDSPAQTNPSMG